MIGVGQQLGGYTILKSIGRGPLGEVYLAQHRRVDRRAAIKVLLPELSRPGEGLERFFEEVRKASQIKHPGIVEILDCDLIDGEAFVIQQFLEGESLAGYLRRNGVPKEDLAFPLAVAAAAAGAVGSAHLAGIMHHNLKPENIYLELPSRVEPTVTVKVLDFGASRLSATGATAAPGEQAGWRPPTTYTSPEQCRAGPPLDARSDVYSLGCVLYEALCGKPPFGPEGLSEVLAARGSPDPRAPIKFVPTLSPKLNTLILRMLAPDPAARPQTMTQVVTALRDGARGLGIDVEGQLLPLAPVERQVKLMVGAFDLPSANPARQVVPAVPEAVRNASKGTGGVVSEPAEPNRSGRTRVMGIVLPPAPEQRVRVVAAINVPLLAEAAVDPVGARGVLDGPIETEVARTMILSAPSGGPAVPQTLIYDDVHDRSTPQPSVGGTMIFDVQHPQDWPEPLSAPAPLLSGVVNTQPVESSWRMLPGAIAQAVLRRNRMLAVILGVLAGGVLLMTILIFSRSPAGPPANSPVAWSDPPVPPRVPDPPSLRAVAAETVQIDIQGIAAGSMVTIDGQPTKLPIRIVRGPQVHRIGLRSPAGDERGIEIDGSRDRVIELLVERPTSRGSSPPSKKAVGHPLDNPSPPQTQSPSLPSRRPPPKMPAARTNGLRAITDL